jgi:uncharacterized delta-60 repeat protein
MRRWIFLTLAVALSACGSDDDGSGGDGGTNGDGITGDDGTGGGDGTGGTGGDDGTGGTGGDDGTGGTDDGGTGPSAVCGDGVIEGNEECDDGNTVNDDECTNDCAANADKDLWTQTHEGGAGSDDAAYGIASDSAGNVLVAGYVEETDTNADIWVRKYDPDGTEIWTVTHDGGISADDRAFDIAVGADDGPVVVGRTQMAEGNADVWVHMLDASGVEVWTQTFDDPAGGDDQANGVAIDGDGNILVVGQIRVDVGNNDIWVRKYDAAGTEQWTQTHDGPANGSDEARAVAADSSGNVIVAGYESVADEGDDMWIRKYDPSGTEVWTHSYAGASHAEDRASGVAVDSSDGVVFVGHSRVGAGGHNVLMQRLDADSTVTVTYTYNGPAAQDDQAHAVVLDAEDTAILVGYRGVAEDDRDIWVRTVDTNNVVGWTQSFAGAAASHDEGHAVALDPDGNILVAGEITESGNRSDVFVAKLSP